MQNREWRCSLLVVSDNPPPQKTNKSASSTPQQLTPMSVCLLRVHLPTVKDVAYPPWLRLHYCVTLSPSALTPLPISPPFVMPEERLSSQVPPPSILFSETLSSPVSLTALLSSSRLFSSVTLSSSSCSLWIFSSVLSLSTGQESWELFRLFITVDKHAEKQMEFVLQMVQKA